jgi:hypothetical protein
MVETAMATMLTTPAGSVELLERSQEIAALADASGLARELAMRAPTVIVVEDVHWADEATLDVVRLLGRRIDNVPALVVLSYRDDALERTHPLRLVLGELATGGSWSAQAHAALRRGCSPSWRSRTRSMS